MEFPHGLLHLLRHEVEIPGYRADLVLAADGRPAGKLSGSDGPGGPGEPHQRSGQQPGHRIGEGGAQHRHSGKYAPVGALLALAHGVKPGNIVGGIEIQGFFVGLHRAGEKQPVLPGAAVHHLKPARPRVRQDIVLGKRIADVGLEQHALCGGQPQGGPGGAVLEAELVHGPHNGLAVQIGRQAVDNLQSAPGHAVGGEGRVLLPLQGVLKEA